MVAKVSLTYRLFFHLLRKHWLRRRPPQDAIARPHYAGQFQYLISLDPKVTEKVVVQHLQRTFDHSGLAMGWKLHWSHFRLFLAGWDVGCASIFALFELSETFHFINQHILLDQLCDWRNCASHELASQTEMEKSKEALLWRKLKCSVLKLLAAVKLKLKLLSSAFVLHLEQISFQVGREMCLPITRTHQYLVTSELYIKEESLAIHVPRSYCIGGEKRGDKKRGRLHSIAPIQKKKSNRNLWHLPEEEGEGRKEGEGEEEEEEEEKKKGREGRWEGRKERRKEREGGIQGRAFVQTQMPPFAQVESWPLTYSDSSTHKTSHLKWLYSWDHDWVTNRALPPAFVADLPQWKKGNFSSLDFPLHSLHPDTFTPLPVRGRDPRASPLLMLHSPSLATLLVRSKSVIEELAAKPAVPHWGSAMGKQSHRLCMGIFLNETVHLKAAARELWQPQDLPYGFTSNARIRTIRKKGTGGDGMGTQQTSEAQFVLLRYFMSIKKDWAILSTKQKTFSSRMMGLRLDLSGHNRINPQPFSSRTHYYCIPVRLSQSFHSAGYKRELSSGCCSRGNPLLLPIKFKLKFASVLSPCLRRSTTLVMTEAKSLQKEPKPQQKEPKPEKELFGNSKLPSEEPELLRPTAGSWESYINRFDCFLDAIDLADISDHRKKSYFLSFCGASEILSNHYSPKPSQIARCHAFRRQTQAEGESISGYMAALRTAALHCGFRDYLEGMLLDQLVCGVRDLRLQRCLLAKGDLTLKTAIEEAQVAEFPAIHFEEAVLEEDPEGASEVNRLRQPKLSQKGNRPLWRESPQGILQVQECHLFKMSEKGSFSQDLPGRKDFCPASATSDTSALPKAN
ncbi:hypothetical protein L345_09128, partial [Ophiophagus hannah]